MPASAYSPRLIAEELTGPAYEQQRAHLAADAAVELDRPGKAPPMPPRPPRFGDVWSITGGVMGPEPWLIVSNDLYLELSETNMLAGPIRDTSRSGSRVVTEPIPARKPTPDGREPGDANTRPAVSPCTRPTA
jgi:hypothetical protein